jgi:flavin reductase (DIM6/NTAB) family NADH-FMN oxidoreductase RutF
MELDPEGKHADRAYAILASPIAWKRRLTRGAVNAAPFSFFNVLGSDPPIVGFCPGDQTDGTPKDTATNVRPTHERRFIRRRSDEQNGGFASARRQ